MNLGAASRADLRSAKGWQAYDRANLVVLTLIALLGLAWWVWYDRALPSDTRPPTTAAAPADARVRMRLSDQALDLRREASGLVLRGALPDEAARRTLLVAARQRFGDAAVTDETTLSAQADTLRWAARAGEVFEALHGMPPPAGLRVLGNVVTLSGEVTDAAERDARETQARRGFGAAFEIDSQLRLRGERAAPAGPASAVAAAGPKASAPAGLCDLLADGVAISFFPNRFSLTPEGRAQVDRLAPCLADGRWVVAGHTDSHGEEAANRRLTRARAEAVVARLVARGLPADRLRAQGLGSAQPLADEATWEGRVRNRRITFTPAD